LEWLLLLLWMCSALAVGYPLARAALPGEFRLAVLLPFGVLGGNSLQAVLLLLFWSAVPLGNGFPLVILVSLGCASLMWWRRPGRPRAAWKLGRLDTGLLSIMLALFGFLAYREFRAGYAAWDAEALYWHSGMVTWLARGTYPPFNPLEPDDPLQYRFGLHAFAAAIGANVPTDGTLVMAAAMSILMPLTVLALVGVSIRLFDNPRPGFVASMLGLFGSSLLPFYRLLQWALGGGNLDVQAREFVSGRALTGNVMDLLHGNVSVAAGLPQFAAALWLASEVTNQPKPRPATYVIGVAAIAYLGLVNEVYFVVLVAGLLAGSALGAIRARAESRKGWWRPAGRAAVLVVAAYMLVQARGGLLGGVAIAGASANSLQMTLNTDHFGSVPFPPGSRDAGWISLLSPEALVDTNFILLILPVLLLVAWRIRDNYLLTGLLAAAGGLIAWTAVYPLRSLQDSYRFGQEAMTVYMVLAPFGIVSLCFRHPSTAFRVRRWLLPMAAIAPMAAHVVMAGWLLTFPSSPLYGAPGTPDYEGAEYLRSLPSIQRVLVPLDSHQDFWGGLYRSSPVPDAMRAILGVGGQSIPMGHHPFSNPLRYRDRYLQASTTFSQDSMASLGIAWVYVVPSALSTEQEHNLQAALGRGEVTQERTFGQRGSANERQLYRVVPSGR
jgi:hypothetical protein